MKDWSFEGFASDFDSHVREQLPWYELVTESVAYIARNYLPTYGLIYDIGCSTGNMSKALFSLIDERKGTILAIDSDESMVKAYQHNIIRNRVGVLQARAEEFEYEEFVRFADLDGNTIDIATEFISVAVLVDNHIDLVPEWLKQI